MDRDEQNEAVRARWMELLGAAAVGLTTNHRVPEDALPMKMLAELAQDINRHFGVSNGRDES